jgi:undecaprenyl-diphosphatase
MIVPGAIGVLVLLAVFAAVAVAVQSGATAGFDQAFLERLRNPADPSLPVGPSWLLEGARDFTALGSYAVLGPLAAFLVLYLWLARQRFDAAYVAISIGSGVLVSNWLKHAFNRQRPVFDNAPDVFSASFPSGHATMSAVVFLTLAVLVMAHEPRRVLRALCIAVAIGVPLLVGASRLYLGVHFPTDVIAGWCLGAAWAVLFALVRQGLVTARPA